MRPLALLTVLPALAALLGLSACASSPTRPDDPPAQQLPPDTGTLSVRVNTRDIVLYVDEQEIHDFRVTPAGGLEVDLLAGRYRVQLRRGAQFTPAQSLRICARQRTVLSVRIEGERSYSEAQEPSCGEALISRPPDRSGDRLPPGADHEMDPCVPFCGGLTASCVKACTEGERDSNDDCVESCALEFGRCVSACQ